MRIALVTCRKLPEPDPDDAPLRAALQARGHEPVAVAWDDPDASLAGFDRFLLRSAWNYYHEPAAFLEWVDRAAALAPFLNPPDVLRWNIHKGYLEELEQRGLPVVPTRVLRRAGAREFAAVLDATGWDDVVVKPCISAASWRTKRFRGDALGDAAAFAAELLAERDVLLQRFEPGALDPGERCLVWIAGEFTHAIRKRPRLEGQDESVDADVPPTAGELEVAEAALAPLADRLTYARVDVMPAPDGSPRISEIELMEPSLFFPQGPPAAERLTRALESR